MTPRTPRLLVWLLRAFPAPFRETYAADMVVTFADRRAAARRQGRRAVVVLWARTMTSIVVQGLAERRHDSFHQVGHPGASFSRSIRWAVRRLRRSPGFTIAAFVTLTVGLACATTVFSLVHGVLLRPLPYPRSERLVSVSHTLQVHGSLQVDQSDASLLFFQRHHRVFTDFGGYQTVAVALGPTPGADAERVAAGRVTSGVFDALRVSPLRGRLFTPADDQPGAAPVVIVAERLWLRAFGGDSALLNRRIVVNDEAREVVGVLSDGVRFPSPDTEVWVPIGLNPAHTDSATFDYQAVARLRDGVSIEHADADLQALLPSLPDEFPGRLTRAAIEATHMRPSVRPLASVMVAGFVTPLWILLAAAGFVLATACANVASLFLVRAENRRKIFAIQRTLGASPGTVLWEFLSEVLVLAGLAGVCALGIAAVALRVLQSAAIAIDIPRLTEVTVDPVVAGLAALATACTALIVGAFAAWRSRPSEGGGLATLHSPTTSRLQHRVRYALVALQVALAMVLVAGSGLMARSLWRLQRIPSGFNQMSALTFRLALPPVAYPGGDEIVRFFARAIETISRVPGVQATGAASKLPLEERAQTSTAVFVESQPMSPKSLPDLYPVSYVTPGYFGAMGIPIVRGETFRRLDPPNVRLETIVSEAFAAHYWPDRSAIGQRVRILVSGPWYTVVGVAGDVRDAALDRPADPMIYCPLLPPTVDQRWMPGDLALVVRTPGDPGAVASAVRSAIRRLDPSLPMFRTQTLEDLVAHASAQRALVLRLVSIASAVALLLGAMGLYGVMAYVVSLRTREIAIRMALGERAAAVGWLVVRQGVAVAMLGVGVGLAGAIGIARALTAWLFDVAPSDPLVLALAAGLVLALATAASWIPSRRATAVNPAVTLRGE